MSYEMCKQERKELMGKIHATLMECKDAEEFYNNSCFSGTRCHVVYASHEVDCYGDICDLDGIKLNESELDEIVVYSSSAGELVLPLDEITLESLKVVYMAAKEIRNKFTNR